MGQKRYMISDASKLIDVQPNVLRYFEEHLSIDINRTEMGHRYYTEKDIELFKSIKALKEQGFPLKAIKMILPNLDKIKSMDPERLEDLKGKLGVAVGLFGLEAKQTLKDKYNKSNVQNLSESIQEKGQATDSTLNDTLSEMNMTDELMEGMFKEEYIKDEEIQKEDKLNDDKLTDTSDKEELFRELNDQKESSETTSEEEPHTSKSGIDSDVKIELQGSMPTTEKINPDKVKQFKQIMCGIMRDAMQEGGENLAKNISDTVAGTVVKELDYMMRVREEREEERYRQLDRTIREHQLSRQQAAAAKELGGKKRESKFFKKNKIRI